ncbi:MAG: SpoIIE family protein phosphatase [Deltaproteobacteria bacterium]|nr:SpoIIE family protein phosphatase [Deltaproteobacteria bacterium]
MSLSIKMILTTTALVIVTVVGSGLLNVVNMKRVFDNNTQQQITVFRTGREQSGEVFTPLFARAVEPALIDKGDDIPTRLLVKSTVTADTKDTDGKKDFGLRFALVLDGNQNVVAHCSEGPDTRCMEEGTHPPVSAALGVTQQAWQAVLAAWDAAAKAGNAPLVRVDVAAGDTKYRVFAYPVITGAAATATAALATEPGPRQGYVMLGYDLAPIAWFEAAAEDEKAAAVKRAMLYTAAVGALFALIGTVLAILQGLSISRPIKQLAYRADQIARGDLRTRVDVSSRDEIGVLGQNFNFMADQINLLLEQTAEKARMDQEIEVARAIQETLVPSSEPVTRGQLEFAGYYEPAAQTGGDWWTWHELAGGKILLVIGDVTGHGVPSAMITAAAKAACDVARHIHGDEVTVTKLLEIMNHAIYESAQRKFVMTCFASIVDPKARTITYANAAHNFPYLYRVADGKGEFGSLMIRGNRLGDDPASRYEAKTTELRAGDVIVWYTDGIVECDGPDGEEYGEKRFRASVKKTAALAAAEMRDSIVADAMTYFNDAPRKDDITLILGRIS